MIVTFCGHGDETYPDEIRKKLNDTIEELILQGADVFLLGGYGKFDQMAATAVNAQKRNILILNLYSLCHTLTGVLTKSYTIIQNIRRLKTRLSVSLF